MDKPHPRESNGLLNPYSNMDRPIVTEITENSKKMDDWKVTLIGGSCACAAVFVVNLGITIWSSVSLKNNQSSRRIIYEGSCSTTRNMNLGIHLVINVFGSILLSASNYGMQCLSTPTRADVDKAHAHKRWVDIGIPSFRNLRIVSAWRVALWWLLIFSSVPLHLLLNSVVYSSLTAFSYKTLLADKNLQLLKEGFQYSGIDNDTVAEFESKITGSQFDNLTALECINQYGTMFLTKRIDVVLVVDTSPSKSESKRAHEINSTLVHNVRRATSRCFYSDYDWICPKHPCENPCHLQLPQVKLQSDDWRPFGDRVEYCLSEPAPQKCRLNFDIYLAGIVLGVNLIKATILAFIVFRPPKEPMFVLGDAIQSFLTRPDEHSRGNCLASARIVRDGLFTRPSIMHTQPKRRGVAVTKPRWIFSLVMYGVAFAVSCGLLTYGIINVPGPHDLKSLWGLGFGTANELTLIQGRGFTENQFGSDENIFFVVLISNLPQLIFSLLYFQYNSLFTAMAAAKEWSDFGHKRRPLRVSSNPRGQQRSRYFLQLPYRFSIPLVLVSILVHWMLSQSIFIVIIEKFNKVETKFEYQDAMITCGYSPVAIFCVVIVSVLMATAVGITAFRRLPTGMPVVASCSLAIAAACHQPDGFSYPEASLLPLQWGVMCIEKEVSVRETTDHCGFSHGSVEQPQDGQSYY
ncbi:hypothetical protein FSST1_005301 [Fusarium sambucinum]